MSRTASQEYRETLDAKSQEMEDGSTVINQYKITDTIGRGSYGTVRKAVLTEDPSVQFAVKEFGKTRLRKTYRASNLRKPGRGRGVGRPGNRSDPTKGDKLDKQADEDANDPLNLIRHEIAILKKLHHPHVVKLIEVLDDPSKDNLYMVFDYCPDGPVIDIKLGHKTEPLPEDIARLYFVQMLMGIEYLHENEIVHRDIKPDNVLLSDSRRTCKIVDFGVSEMFLKPGDDTMQKSAGSPAFMSPELCTAGHQEYHGKADDIWSFGVTLYCMVVGHLPFEKDNFYEIYEAIKNDEPEYPDHLSKDLADLLHKMLAKNPDQRITIAEVREHPWTLAVEDGILLSREENIEKVVGEPTEEELDCAICKITNIFTFARAISRFKKGGSMARARKEASQSSDSRDASWFPPSTPSPDKQSRTDSPDDAAEIATIKEETPMPESPVESKGEREQGAGEEKGDEKQDKDEKVQDLEKRAAYMFESPQIHTFELPTEEPNGNGPLQRNRSGPISTLHRDEIEEGSTGPPVISMDSPRSASPEMFASPTSESAEPDQQDSSRSNLTRRKSAENEHPSSTSKPEDILQSHLSDMMLSSDQKEHHRYKHKYESPAKAHWPNHGEDGKPRAQSLQERAASWGQDGNKSKPKLLPDEPTVMSPMVEELETPPLASEVYVQCKHGTEDSQEEKEKGKDENPYFSGKVRRPEKHGTSDLEDEGEREELDESERQALTV